MRQIVMMMTAAALLMAQQATAQVRVKNLYTETASLKVEQVQNTAEPVQVMRYLFAGYNTLCLPMALSPEQLGEKGIRAERLAAIQQEGTTLCLYFVDCTDEGTEAGVPYLINSAKSQYLRVKNTDAERIATELKTIRMADAQGNQVAFSGSWEKRQKDGYYGIPSKQDTTPLESILVRTSADLAFLPTRCGFSWESQSATAERLEIRHVSASDVTGIQNALQVRGTQTGEAYDLSGRQLTAPAKKGLYIQDGRKVVR